MSLVASHWYGLPVPGPATGQVGDEPLTISPHALQRAALFYKGIVDRAARHSRDEFIASKAQPLRGERPAAAVPPHRGGPIWK